jgi:hypothetical protein
MTTQPLTRLPCLALLVCMALSGMPSLSAEDDIKAHARAVLASAADANVTVRCVMKIKVTYAGQKQDQEQKVEMNAVTIDPTGLFVTTAAQLDPGARLAAMSTGSRRQQYTMDTEIKDLRVLLADGTEHAAEIALTDIDLDLAFLRLKQQADHLATVSFADPAPASLPLDDIFVLGRASKEANRTPLLCQGRITCRVKGPEPYYLCDQSLAANVGCMVYDGAGRPIGLQVRNPPAGDGNASNGMFLSGQSGFQTVIRPVDQILDLAKQARTAPAEPKPDPGTPPAARAP